jgi:hypothetical protein
MASFNQLIDKKIANANFSCRDIFFIAQKTEKSWQKYQPDDVIQVNYAVFLNEKWIILRFRWMI